ncbi:MAG: hypothetical protein WBM69_20410, partial [Desulfobacterales bacterium]
PHFSAFLGFYFFKQFEIRIAVSRHAALSGKVGIGIGIRSIGILIFPWKWMSVLPIKIPSFRFQTVVAICVFRSASRYPKHPAPPAPPPQKPGPSNSL